jgi:Fe2+ or Zn2+ uptake regulation protein
LRERGVRVALQGARTWGLLAEFGERLTAKEVWERAREATPGLKPSPVYRLAALRSGDWATAGRGVERQLGG